MDRMERFYKIDRILRDYKIVPAKKFMEELKISRATFRRDIEYMQDRLNAPIEWDKNARGYRFSTDVGEMRKYSLPGLWFSASETHALLTMNHLLDNVSEGMLTPHVKPLMDRIQAIIGDGDSGDLENIHKRVRILHMANRKVNPPFFSTAAFATLKRKMMRITYFSRSAGNTEERDISPQRITHYRDNWYLDAFCHSRNDIRCFSIDSILAVELYDKKAKEISEKEMDAVLATGYGIFSGKKTENAVLKFSPRMSRWISSETWHPEQNGSFTEDGYYVLRFPFSNPTELLMDIMKYGQEVEVISPETLRAALIEKLSGTLKKYSK